jgi:hypothetical protein
MERNDLNNLGKCVHCLKIFDSLTWDHVFPKAWYPDTTDPNLYKWQIPSCKRCNNEYGNLENDLLIRFAMCLDPSDPDCTSIVEKGERAVDPKCAKGKKDRDNRQAKRKKVIREMSVGESIPQKHIYPNFGLYPNIPIQEQGSISIKKYSIERLAEKIVRGIVYMEDKKFIEPPLKIELLVLHDKDAKQFIEIVRQEGAIYAREPGIVVNRAVFGEISLFIIEIWKRFKMYVTVLDHSKESSV